MLREVPEGWQATRLGDLAEIIGGTTPSKSEARYWTNGTIAWATPSDVTKLPLGVTWLESTASQITEEALDATSLHLLPPGSVLMTSRATIGYPVINSVPMTTNQGFANFLPNPNYDARFLVAWIDHSRPTLEKLSSGSTFLELSKRTLRAVQVALPPIHEQHRIADILASVDETIEATEAVIEQARTAKQGVLARLLTRGIKHTRFKQTAIGEVPEAWEVSPLSKVIKLRRGFAFKSQD